jgi:xanthine dehydrogenase accessory factor
MSLDRDALAQAIARHGRVARVLVASVAGSTPREVGAAMLVWPQGQSGTIGGGALEFQAALRAREALASGRDRLDRVPLGPQLGQCCGGAVALLTELWDRARLERTGPDVLARPLPARETGDRTGTGTGALPPEMPLPVRRRLADLRCGAGGGAALVAGWMVEPVFAPARDLWVWGAGHVGRAVVGLMAPLPGWRITWIDTAADRFPDPLPEGIDRRVAENPGALVAEAPAATLHLVMTYSHALDLDLCHRLLVHGFGSLGLIGSDTKAARFRSRLRALGHGEAEIARIVCPIGRKSFGKHPQAIAVGVAADLLSERGHVTAAKDATG